MTSNLPQNLQSVDPGFRLGDIAGLARAIAEGKGQNTADGLTASTTQTLAAATQLQYGINRITTVTNGSDAVKMPTALPGTMVVIVNNGGNIAQLFPSVSTEVINAAVAGAAVTVADATVSVYVCAVAGRWNGGAITFEA